MRNERSVRDGVGSNFSGGRTKCVTAAERKVTFKHSADPGKMTKGLEGAGAGETSSSSHFYLSFVRNKYGREIGC